MADNDLCAELTIYQLRVLLDLCMHKSNPSEKKLHDMVVSIFV